MYDYEDSRGGGISIGLGPNNCPAVLLYHPTGYTAVVSSMNLLSSPILSASGLSVMTLETHARVVCLDYSLVYRQSGSAKPARRVSLLAPGIMLLLQLSG